MTTVQFRYEMRRECQEILPGLLLGPFVASKSLETLTGLKVSHMYVVGSHLRQFFATVTSIWRVNLSSCLFSVCIRDAKEAFSVRPRFPEHFNYMVLDVEDNEEQNLIRLFPAWGPYSYILLNGVNRLLFLCSASVLNSSLTKPLEMEDVFLCIVMVSHSTKCLNLYRNIILHRGNQSITSIRSHVCHATLSTFMGRRVTHGSEPTLLHITQWRVLDTNKGILL